MAPAVCLGEGSYAARFIRRRTLLGPARPIGEAPVIAGSWGRQLLLTTDGSATFAIGDDPRCAGILAQLEPWRDELELYREPGGLCWVGPIQNVIANPEQATATVTAKDLSAWFAKRRLPTIVSRGQDLASIAAAYIAACFATDDPGIEVAFSPTGILGDRTVAAEDLKLLGPELDELARTGVDWTVANRQFWAGGTEISGRLPGRVVDEHFRVAPQTRRSGEGMTNDAAVRGNAVQGQYGGPDPIDGVWLQGVSDEPSIEDQGSADAAARSEWELASEPLLYLEGENALDPRAPFRIEQFVPGIVAAIDVSGGGVVPLRQDLRLEKIAVSFDADGEQVNVAFQPVGTTAAA